MKKFLVLLTLVVAVAAIYCCCNKNSYYSKAINSVTTEKTPEIAPINKGTTTPTLKPTITSSPTVASTTVPTSLPNPYNFAGKTGNTNLSYGPIVMKFTEGALLNKEIAINLISPENLGKFGSTSEAFKVGNGVGLIRVENYGNLLLMLHSGVTHGKDLEAESLRFFLERYGNKSREYVLGPLSDLVGFEGSIYINGIPLVDLEVLAGVRLQNAQAKEIQMHPLEVLDIVAKKDAKGDYLADGNEAAFKAFENSKDNSHKILITFCGGGPDRDPTYYRYVLLIEVNESY